MKSGDKQHAFLAQSKTDGDKNRKHLSGPGPKEIYDKRPSSPGDQVSLESLAKGLNDLRATVGSLAATVNRCMGIQNQNQFKGQSKNWRGSPQRKKRTGSPDS